MSLLLLQTGLSDAKQFFRRTKPARRRISRAIRKFRYSQPLTVKGVIAAALSIFIFQQFGKGESDLIATMLGGGILLFISIALLGVALLRRRLQRITIKPHFDRQNCYSQIPMNSGLTVKQANVPPFFSVYIRRVFDNRKVRSTSHILYGSEEIRKIVDDSVFPHRALWTLARIEISVRDTLGFVELTWELPLEERIEVSAKTIPIKPLPVLAASSRSGDQMHFAQERSGDPYDIKPYDPSDGVKRILWKAYARSREVVVRRPEPAVVPEGEVAIYLIANKDEDHVAGALQSYLNLLYDSQITVLFGTGGITASRGLVGSTKQKLSAMQGSEAEQLFTSRPEEIQRVINRSVWSAQAGTAQGFEAYLEALQASNRTLTKVLLFAPTTRAAWLKDATLAAEKFNISLTIVAVPESFREAYSVSSLLPHTMRAGYSEGSLVNYRQKIVKTIRNFGKKKTHLPLGQETLLLHASKQGIDTIRCERAEGI